MGHIVDDYEILAGLILFLTSSGSPESVWKHNSNNKDSDGQKVSGPDGSERSYEAILFTGFGSVSDGSDGGG